MIQDAETRLWDCLNGKATRQKPGRSRFGESVRRKNLEKVHGYLHALLFYLGASREAADATEATPHADQGGAGAAPAPAERRAPAAGQTPRLASLAALLAHLEDPDTLSFNGAWELSDLLEVELARVADDAYLYAHLAAVGRGTDGKDTHSLPAIAAQLCDAYAASDSFDDKARGRARAVLEQVLLERIAEYRRHRAMADLRGQLLSLMATVLGVLLVAFGVLYVAASSRGGLQFLLPLTAVAGATGSVLSRAYKIGKAPLKREDVPGGTAGEAESTPFGIRAMIAAWKVLLPQSMIGAASALVLFLIFRSGILQIGGQPVLDAADYGVIGFVAGAAEPFVLSTLDRLAGTWGPTAA